MGRQWERLYGNTDELAIRIAFSPDPDDGEGATTEESASWGAFQLWVRGRNLCRHLEDGEELDSAHWYLLPLLEWVTTHWDALLHEERLPSDRAGETAWSAQAAWQGHLWQRFDVDDSLAEWRQGWSERHSLLTAREGGLFPDVMLRRFRDRCEVSWGPWRSAGMPPHFRFLDSAGFALVDLDTTAQALFDLLTDASEHLARQLPRSQRIAALQAAVKRLSDPQATSRRLALLAGLGDRVEAMQVRWRQVQERLFDALGDRAERLVPTRQAEPALVLTGSTDAALMFGSLTPQLGDEDVLRLARVLIKSYEERSAQAPALEKMARPEPIDDRAPAAWSQGYDLALEFLAEQGIDSAAALPIDIDALIGRLGVRVLSQRLDDTGTRGVAIAGPQHRPTILINESHPFNERSAGCRMTKAHELCHLLYDRDEGATLAMGSGPWAPKALEQRANAFAAMLLMPSFHVRAAISDQPTPLHVDDIAEVAQRLGTGYTATLRHLRNLDYLSDADLERLDAEMERTSG